MRGPTLRQWLKAVVYDNVMLARMLGCVFTKTHRPDGQFCGRCGEFIP